MKTPVSVIKTALTVLLITLFIGCSNNKDVLLYQVPATAEDIHPLLVGAEIPELTLRNSEGDPVDLNAVISNKPTVLLFYRGGWCPVCNMQLSGIKTIESELVRLGYQFIGISADRPEKIRSTIKKHDQKYLLLSDNKMTGAKAFGIAFKVDEKTLNKYKEYGIDLEDASGETHHILPVPAVFVIGTDGIIKFEYINPDYRVRLDPEVLLAAAKAVKRSNDKKRNKKKQN